MFYCRGVISSRLCQAVEHTAMQFLKFIAYKSEFLSYKPSHQAAAVSILTVNIFTCPVAFDLGLTKSTTQAAELKQQMFPKVTSAKDALAIWIPQIEKLTLIKRIELETLYTNILIQLDSKQFKNQLSLYRELWLN